MIERETVPVAHAQLVAAFDAALEVPAGKREAWLEENYRDQPELLQRVRRLLDRERAGKALFDELEIQRSVLLGTFLGEGRNETIDPRIGRHYGPWQVVAHIGSGGLAEVYDVRRADGRYDQRGALKILRNGILGQHARSLFLRERRLLANLDHPGIVRIIDGGETTTGSPWLVMELAEGLSIDRYCEEHGIPLAARLALLADAADIMSAAHANLVVHGDLKAEHIIVSQTGGLRLLDFGIAQALDDEGLGGPAAGFSADYASPEQQSGQGLTAASDIFQLGQVIRHVAGNASHRLPLSAVVARATAHDPQNRYASMASLAADLRAVVDDRAIAAAPDNRWQAIARTMRHNRLAAALAGVALVGSIGWATTATLSTAAIEKQRTLAVAAADRERRGKEILLQLFQRADLLEADSLGMDPSAAASMLDDALASARNSLKDDPAMLADLINWTARAHERAGDPDQERKLVEEELAVLGASELRGSLREASAKAYYAFVLATAGESEAADHYVTSALATLGDKDPADPVALDLLISAAWTREGDWVAQEALFRRALAVAEKVGSANAKIEVHDGLARALAGLGRIDEARKEIGLSLAEIRDNFGESHPRTSLPLSDLGRIEERAGNGAEAVAAHRRALAISERFFGAQAPETRSHRNNLANALVTAGDVDGAIREYQNLVDTSPDGLGKGQISQNLAVALIQVGDYARAEQYLKVSSAAFARHLPSTHPRQAFPGLTRSEMRLAQGRYKEAEADARAALAHLEKSLPNGHYATETARCRIGITLLGEGKPAAAAGYIRPALKALEAGGSGVPARYLEPCRDAAKKL